MTGLLEIRGAELDSAVRWLPPSGRILELGGGSGYQAALLARRGYEVISLDVPSRPQPDREFHPVEIFDGAHIPHPDDAFDVIFSSNVLEHVGQLTTLLDDTRRVLRPDGVALHLMPTSTWRFWNSLDHYVDVSERVLRKAMRLRTGEPRRDHAHDVGPGAPSARSRIVRLLVPEPHGRPDASALVELRTFSRGYWVHRLSAAGFQVCESPPNGIFYTGTLRLGLSLRKRRMLARILGSSCRLYVLRPVARKRPVQRRSTA